MELVIDLVRALREADYQQELSDELEGFDDCTLRHAAADELDRLRIENERLSEGLWRARADLDNAHREIMPRVNELAHGAMRAAQIVDPPV